MCGRDIDNAAELVLAHRWQRRPPRMTCRRQVDRQDRVPFLGRKLIEWRDILDARIVDEHVEPTMLGEGRLDHLPDCCRLGHVSRRVTYLDIAICRYPVLGPGDLGGNAVRLQKGVRLEELRAGEPG